MSEANTTPRITVTLSPHQDIPKGLVEEDMVAAANFVMRSFLTYLPEDMTLDGSDELEIRLGTEGEDFRFIRKGKKAIAYQPRFDFQEYKKAGREGRETILLEALGAMVDRIAHAFRDDRRAVKKARKDAAKNGLEVSFPVERLCGDVPEEVPGKTIQVLRTLTRNGERWHVEVLGKKGRVLKKDKIAQGVDRTKARKRFQGFTWRDSEFVLVSQAGKDTYSLDLATA